MILESVPGGDICVQQSLFHYLSEDSDHCFFERAQHFTPQQGFTKSLGFYFALNIVYKICYLF